MRKHPSRTFPHSKVLYISRTDPKTSIATSSWRSRLCDREKPYWGEIDFAVVEAARRRLADHGYPFAFSGPPQVASSEKDTISVALTSGSVELVPGASIDVRITVGRDGDLSLALI